MAALESCPKHNMVTYLEKTDGHAEFHEIIDFLTHSSIHNALTIIDGKPASISEASIRNDLQFNDVAGIDVLPNQAIFDTIQLMGNVTPLFPSMLAQPTEDEGAVSERQSETQTTPSPTHPSEDQSELQPDPFLRPSSSNPILDSIPEGSGGNHGG
ncbi:hypothetical protein Tco_1470135 [Tanacetum coccineum]